MSVHFKIARQYLHRNPVLVTHMDFGEQKMNRGLIIRVMTKQEEYILGVKFMQKANNDPKWNRRLILTNMEDGQEAFLRTKRRGPEVRMVEAESIPLEQ